MNGVGELKSENTFATALIAKPLRLVLGIAALQVALLTIISTLVSRAPPLDVVEGWTWAPHWLLGTHKHPPGPAWLLQAIHAVIPGHIFSAYLLSQLCIAITYICIYFCGRVLLGERQALAGTLLLQGSLYFTYLSPEFNHNVLQMPIWAGAILAYACLLKSPQRTGLWLVLGVVIGCGMYAKYSVAILAVVIAVSGLFFTQIRAQYLTWRPWVAGTVSITIFLPHIIWLIRNDFLPFAYAEERSISHGSIFQPLLSLLTQIGDHLPMLILLAVVGFPLIRMASRQKAGDDARLFLRIVTFAPFLMIVAGAMISGKSLRDMWGMPLFTTVGLWLVMELGRVWDATMLKRLARAAVGMIVLTSVVFVAEGIWALSHFPARKFWPMAEVSSKLDAYWKSKTDAPLTIAGGDGWVAGLVAINSDRQVDVIPDGDLRYAPWVTAEDIRQRGMLYVSLWSGAQPPDYCPNPGPIEEIPLSNRYLPSIRVAICYPQNRVSRP